MTIETRPSSGTDTELLARAIDRLATALEQLVLTRLDTPHPANNHQPFVEPQGTHFETIEELPRTAPLANCPVHNQPWKYVPAGVSKKNGKPYEAFYACPVTGCNQRPPTR